MNTDAPKDEDLAVSAAIDKPRTPPPPHAGGDTIMATVGDGAQHVVVGKNIRIGNFNVPRWLLIAVGLSCVVLLASVAFQAPALVRAARAEAPLVKCLFPLEMDDTKFNVVMTPFTSVGADGRTIESRDGAQLARILFRYLEPAFGPGSAVPSAIRSPEQACVLAGSNDAERLAAAAALAMQVKANVVVYGTINTQTFDAQFEPRFYVRYEGFEEAPELTGPQRLGTPIFVSLPINPEDYQGLADHQLGIRMQVLGSVILGLASYAQDNYKQAIDYFAAAEQMPGWLDDNGKEIIYVLLGNAYSRRAGQELQAAYLEPALSYYDQALALEPASARATLGKAGVVYQLALGDLKSLVIDQINGERLDEAEHLYRQVLHMSVSESSSIIAAKSRLGLAQLLLVRFYITSDTDMLVQAQAQLNEVIASHQSGELPSDELAGHAEARLAVIADLQGDRRAAAGYYRRAVELVGPYSQVQYLLNLAGLLAAEGKAEEARTVCDSALLRARSLGDKSLIHAVEETRKSLDAS